MRRVATAFLLIALVGLASCQLVNVDTSATPLKCPSATQKGITCGSCTDFYFKGNMDEAANTMKIEAYCKTCNNSRTADTSYAFNWAGKISDYDAMLNSPTFAVNFGTKCIANLRVLSLFAGVVTILYHAF